MHLADGTIPVSQAAVYWAASGTAVAVGIRSYYKKSSNNLEFKILCGVFAAFLFIATIIEFPMPFGSTEHPTGTPLVAIFMGPVITPFLSMVVLVLELFFKEGAVTTLGANVFSLGIAGGLTGWGLFYITRKIGLNLFIAGFVAGVAGDLAVYLITAMQLALGGQGGESFIYYFMAFVPGQVPLAVLEGIFTGLVLQYVYKRRPEIIQSRV